MIGLFVVLGGVALIGLCALTVDLCCTENAKGWNAMSALTGIVMLLVGGGMAMQSILWMASKPVVRHDPVYRGVLTEMKGEYAAGKWYTVLHFEDGTVLHVKKVIDTPLYLNKYQEITVQKTWDGPKIVKVFLPQGD